MVPNPQAAGASQIDLSAEPQSRLLKLPPELRNKIYELALSSTPIYITSQTQQREKPALLQVNRQIRNEARLMFYHFATFIALRLPGRYREVRQWGSNMADDELRSIQNFCLHIDFGYFRDAGEYSTRHIEVLGKLAEVLSSLVQRGLAMGAIHVRERAAPGYSLKERLLGDIASRQERE